MLVLVLGLGLGLLLLLLLLVVGGLSPESEVAAEAEYVALVVRSRGGKESLSDEEQVPCPSHIRLKGPTVDGQNPA